MTILHNDFRLTLAWLSSQKAALVINAAALVQVDELSEAERIDIDQSYQDYKAAGGHHQDNDARALRLEQRYEPHL